MPDDLRLETNFEHYISRKLNELSDSGWQISENDNGFDADTALYMDDFIRENSIDTLVLGCTHYPLIRKNIEKIYPGLNIINPSYEIIGRVRQILENDGTLADEDNDRENIFYASDLSENFENMIQKILETEKSNLNLKFKNLEL